MLLLLDAHGESHVELYPLVAVENDRNGEEVRSELDECNICA